MKTMIKTLCLAVGAATLLSSSASATQITGSIGFGGGGYTVDNPNLALASEFTSFFDVTTKGFSSGDYATVPTDEAVVFTPFAFDGSQAEVISLWTFTIGSVTYSLDATSVNRYGASARGLLVGGNAIAYITGFDPTPGEWSITATKGRTSFNFASAAAVTPVPERVPDGGFTLALLGTALTGLGILRRKVAC